VTVTATSDVAPRDAGLASGLVTMGRQIGGAVGLAALVTLAGSVSRHSGLHGQAATLHGYRAALLAAAGVSIAGAVAALFLRKPGHLDKPSNLAKPEHLARPPSAPARNQPENRLR